MPYRACYPILKLVYSAAANANYNMDSNESNLVISKAQVSEGNSTSELHRCSRIAILFQYQDSLLMVHVKSLENMSFGILLRDLWSSFGAYEQWILWSTAHLEDCSIV
ncbi:hypothetical protein POM88_045613 [Heracleum sosnowskyi]|uniref:Uncharacterized protein n=1 Tax=Heracleum sosnowskyi TaxID=360622 RepID=A0AAD8H7K8_9APIA|nr:hypothetical protein POM88_045613 [Heracleum sosnowskyi]